MKLGVTVVAFVALVACDGKSNDRPSDRSGPGPTLPMTPTQDPAEARIPGGLATPAEQRAALDAFQGQWRFQWTISTAPADAKETIWKISGTSFEVIDGSRHRAFTLQIVAPCLARLVGPQVDAPFIPFLIKPDGLQLSVGGGSLGFRRGEKIILCSRAGQVFIQDGAACSALRFGWNGEPPQPLTVTCEHRRSKRFDEIIFHHGEFSDSAHFTGDDLSETPLPAPAKPMR